MTPQKNKTLKGFLFNEPFQGLFVIVEKRNDDAIPVSRLAHRDVFSPPRLIASDGADLFPPVF
jgi:hypothetical protein